VAELEEFNRDDPGADTTRAVRDRLAFATTFRQLTIDDQRLAWDGAIDSIADRARCPKYGGLRIAPQLGLIPLGRNDASGLWEFAHLPSGAVPQRDDEKRLALTPETGIVLVVLPGGTFRMGSPASEASRNKD